MPVGHYGPGHVAQLREDTQGSLFLEEVWAASLEAEMPQTRWAQPFHRRLSPQIEAAFAEITKEMARARR